MPRKTSSDKKNESKSCILRGTPLGTDTNGESTVAAYLQNLAAQPAIPVSVDISDVSTLSISGINILLGLAAQCKKDDRTLSLTGVSGEMESLLKSLELSDIFTFSKAE